MVEGDLFIEFKPGFAGWINVFFCSSGKESQSGDLVRLRRTEGQNNISKILITRGSKDAYDNKTTNTKWNTHTHTTVFKYMSFCHRYERIDIYSKSLNTIQRQVTIKSVLFALHYLWI